jgi:hypothetical protein
VISPENVVIFDSSVHNNEGSTTEQFILQWPREDYRFGFLSAMFDSFKALNNFPVREDRSGDNLVVGMGSGVGEIQRLSTFEDSNHDIAVNIFRRSLSDINEFRRNKEGFVESEREIAFHEFEGHPSPLIAPKVYVGIRDALIGNLVGMSSRGPQCYGDYRINYDEKTNDKFRRKFHFLASLFSVCLGYLFVGWGAGLLSGVAVRVSAWLIFIDKVF